MIFTHSGLHVIPGSASTFVPRFQDLYHDLDIRKSGIEFNLRAKILDLAAWGHLRFGDLPAQRGWGMSMKTFRRTMALGISTVLGIAGVVGVGVSGASAATKDTGRPCATYYFFDGQGIQQAGYRCAQGRITYSAASGNRWLLSSYQMYYSVSAGLSYGPHNNENPFKVSAGFQSGTSSYLSPDDGASNQWISRNNPDAYTYSGQTRVQIDAYPDVPGAGDPRLDADTATW